MENDIKQTPQFKAFKDAVDRIVDDFWDQEVERIREAIKAARSMVTADAKGATGSDPGMTDFCTECGEVFETLTNRPNDDAEKDG